jgi:HEAT repeat protein
MEGLVKCMGPELEPDIRLAAAEALARLQHDEGIETLLKLLRHEDVHVRSVAAKTFSQLGTDAVEKFSDRVFGALISAVNTDTEFSVQNAAMKSVADHGKVAREFAGPILMVAQNGGAHAHARQDALRALIECGDAAAQFIDEVRDLAVIDGDYAHQDKGMAHVRLWAAEFLARHGEVPVAIEVLTALSKHPETVIHLFVGLAYRRLCEDCILDEKDHRLNLLRHILKEKGFKKTLEVAKKKDADQ